MRGQSTFMVEMSETSAILHTATARSLVLLDEIGRGTSTYDGVSIAWAVTEHLHNAIGCKTVFATHYHELTQLADELDALRNFNVAVREAGEQILFLHRLRAGRRRSLVRHRGRSPRRTARRVIQRARRVLALLEGEQLVRGLGRRAHRQTERSGAGSARPFRRPTHPVVEQLALVDANTLTPLEALSLLAKLADDARQRR